MNTIRQTIFLAALEATRETIVQVVENIKEVGPDSEDITSLDDAIEALLETRNAYCKEGNIIIEDGSLNWNRSELQQKEDEEEAQS